MSSSIKADVQIQTSVSLASTRLDVRLRGAASLDADLAPTSLAFVDPATSISVRTTPPVEIEVADSSILRTFVGAQGPAGPSGTGQEAVSVPGFDTLALSAGRMVYATSGGYSLDYADAGSEGSAFSLGAFVGHNGKVQVQGAAELVFESSSPIPVPGRPAYLGSLGKVTAQPPTAGFVSLVGIVAYVPGDFSSAHTATVVVRNPLVYKRGG